MPTFKNFDDIQKHINKQIGSPKFSELFNNDFI